MNDYLRCYQRFLRWPVLRDLVARRAMPFNLLVAHQDRRVVRTQRTKRTALKMGQNLFQGNHPIVAHRMRRQKLLGQAVGSARGAAG